MKERQRLEGRVNKSRSAKERQGAPRPPEAGERQGGSFLVSSESVDALILDFPPSELGENKPVVLSGPVCGDLSPPDGPGR